MSDEPKITAEMLQSVEAALAIFGQAKSDTPSSTVVRPPRGGHKKHKRAVTRTADDEDAASPTTTVVFTDPIDDLKRAGEHQEFVGLIPTYPPAKPPEPKRGRPTTINDYPAEVFDTLYALLAEGYSLNRICMRDEMPGASTVCMWAVQNPAFYERYTRARDIGIVNRANQLRDEMATNPDPIRAKLLFEHDKWYLAKMMPKTYGERSELHTTQTIEHKHTIDVSQLSADQVEALEGVLVDAKLLPAPQDVEPAGK